MTDTTSDRNVDKIAIVGAAGTVGSAFAFAAMLQGLAPELVLIDVNERRVEGEVMDLQHAAAFAHAARITTGSIADCAGADIVAISAGVAQKPGETRLELAQRNVAIMRDLIPQIAAAAPDAILLMVANPVDVLTMAMLKFSGFPPERAFGSGTVLDTMRFRALIGRHCGINPRNVHAYIVGEHGDSELPVWSSANIAGVSVEDYCVQCARCPGEDQLRHLFTEVRDAAYEIIARKGYTNYAIATGMVALCRMILRDERSILTVSRSLAGQYGVGDVCLSLPVVVGRGGAERVIDGGLSAEEVEAFRASAEVVKGIARECGV